MVGTLKSSNRIVQKKCLIQLTTAVVAAVSFIQNAVIEDTASWGAGNGVVSPGVLPGC